MNWYSKLTGFYNKHPILFWLIGGSSFTIVSLVGLFFNFIRSLIPRLFITLLYPTIQISLSVAILVLFVLLAAWIAIRIKRKSLSESDKKIYLNILEKTSGLLQLKSWSGWTAGVLGPRQFLADDIYAGVEDFRLCVFNCLWPKKLSELERSLKTLAVIVRDFIDTYFEHAELKEDGWFGVRFYKIDKWDPEKYHQLLKEYENWGQKLEDLISEATKAVNWIADVVRRDLIPDFYATEGKFTLTTGMYEDMSYRKHIPEYSKKERKGMPYKKKTK